MGKTWIERDEEQGFVTVCLHARYSDYLAEYLRSGFSVRQIGNTYNALSNGMEQMMTLLILVIGA